MLQGPGKTLVRQVHPTENCVEIHYVGVRGRGEAGQGTSAGRRPEGPKGRQWGWIKGGWWSGKPRRPR